MPVRPVPDRPAGGRNENEAHDVSRTKAGLLWIMGLAYIAAGANHFVSPDFYLPMMPPYLPAHLELIYLSGVAEVVLGVAVLVPSLRPKAAIGIVALLIAVFPANLHVALYDVPLLGEATGLGIGNWVRLPVQALLILWAWWYTD